MTPDEGAHLWGVHEQHQGLKYVLNSIHLLPSHHTGVRWHTWDWLWLIEWMSPSLLLLLLRKYEKRQENTTRDIKRTLYVILCVFKVMLLLWCLRNNYLKTGIVCNSFFPPVSDLAHLVGGAKCLKGGELRLGPLYAAGLLRCNNCLWGGKVCLFVY